MNNFSFFACLIFALTLHWSSSIFFADAKAVNAAAAGEIALPKLVNIEKGQGYQIQVTTGSYTRDKDGNWNAVPYDIPLKNCKYNIGTQKINCSFKNPLEKKSYKLTFDMKVTKNTCKKQITNKTKFNKADLYSYESGKASKYEYIVSYLRPDPSKKVEDFKVNCSRFIFTTDANCKLTIDIKKGHMVEIK